MINFHLLFSSKINFIMVYLKFGFSRKLSTFESIIFIRIRYPCFREFFQGIFGVSFEFIIKTYVKSRASGFPIAVPFVLKIVYWIESHFGSCVVLVNLLVYSIFSSFIFNPFSRVYNFLCCKLKNLGINYYIEWNEYIVLFYL